MSYDFTSYLGQISLLAGSLVSPISQAAGMGLVIFGGLIAFGVGTRWVQRLAHAGH